MEDLFICGRLTIPADQLVVTYARSSGPGGQNVNKVNTKVTMRWQVNDNPLLASDWRERLTTRFANRINIAGELVVISERFRVQHKNLEDCRQKLREMLLSCQTPPTVRKETKPTFSSERRRIENKVRQGEKKRLRSRPNFDS